MCFERHLGWLNALFQIFPGKAKKGLNNERAINHHFAEIISIILCHVLQYNTFDIIDFILSFRGPTNLQDLKPHIDGPHMKMDNEETVILMRKINLIFNSILKQK